MQLDENIPLVSVVVPMYNHGAYIEECLDSLAKEGYPRLEVLVLDDGSSDNSFETAQRWFENHPDAFESFSLSRQENQGAARTVNTLIRDSRGKFVSPLASDDKLLPGGIKARVDYLLEHPDLLAVFADCVVMDQESSLISDSALFDFRRSDRRGFRSPKALKDELVMRWTVPGPVLLLRRECFFNEEGVGFFAEDGGIEDRDFFLRLVAKDKLGFIYSKVASYRIHTENTCRPVSREKKIAHYRARYVSESIGSTRFDGYHHLFLRLSTKRFECIISRLERQNFSWYLLELPIGVLMRLMYIFVIIGRRLYLVSD